MKRCGVRPANAASSFSMHNFKKLKVYHLAMDFSVDIDNMTWKFPRLQGGTLGSQMRRAAEAIYAAIAEGMGKDTRPEQIRYLNIALASATETEGHLMKAGKRGFLTPSQLRAMIERDVVIQKMLYRLIEKLP
jgi:four helix bundle protein